MGHYEEQQFEDENELFYLASLYLSSRINWPDLFYNTISMCVVVVVQVDCRINMTRHHLHAVPNPQLLPIRPRQRPVLISQDAISIPQSLAFRESTIRRERFEPRINRDALRSLLANDRCQNSQAIRVLCADCIPIIRVHEQETPGLDLRHPRHRDAEFGRPRATRSDDIHPMPIFPERTRGFDQRHHALETLLSPLLHAVHMLQMSLVSLHPYQLQMLEPRNRPRELQRRLSRLYPRPMQSDI